MRPTPTVLLLAFVLAPVDPLASQLTEGDSTDAEARVERDLFELTDRFGPRLAGTRAYGDAARWMAEGLRGAGADTVYLEAFPDARPGWVVDRHSLEMTTPRYRRLAAHPLPWTPSTPGTPETGPVVAVTPDQVDSGELGREVAGAVVLLGAPLRAQAPEEAPGRRLSTGELERIETNPDPNDLRVGYHARRTLDEHFRSRARRRNRALARIEGLARAGARAVLVPSPVGFGLIRSDGAGILEGGFGGAEAALPVFALAAEDASLLRRLYEGGHDPVVELFAATRTETVPGSAVSVVAEIRGSVSPEEVVLVVAHLDSHVGAPGAGDNGGSVVALLETVRRLTAGPRPERTVRIALTGAEEHGAFGGARRHVEARGEGLVAVLGLDHGPGRVRGVYAMGNPEAAAVLREMATRVEVGAEVVTLQMSNQSDHEVFDEAGIPSFPLVQDPESYVPWTHHTQWDVPDHVDPAALVWNAAAVDGWARELARADVRIPPRAFWSAAPRLNGPEEFFLPGHPSASEVYLVGSFNDWVMFDLPLAREGDGWRTRIELPPGRHLYKFIVDGMWIADPSTPEAERVRDGRGHGGLTVRSISPR